MRLIDVDKFKAVHGMKDDCADCDKELREKSKVCDFDRDYSKMDFCGWLDDAPTVNAISAERIEELEQLDYELYCHTGKSHLNEQQWEWLKVVLKNEDGEQHVL